MVDKNKLSNALYSLQGVIIKARAMAYANAPSAQVADILDAAEMLPRLLATETDETEKYRRYLVEIGQRHKCAYLVQYFDDPAPSKW